MENGITLRQDLHAGFRIGDIAFLQVSLWLDLSAPSHTHTHNLDPKFCSRNIGCPSG
jgi:hypothetical protein